MEADFDDHVNLKEGGMNIPENARAVFELAEDMDLTRVQIDQLWEERELICTFVRFLELMIDAR